MHMMWVYDSTFFGTKVHITSNKVYDRFLYMSSCQLITQCALHYETIQRLPIPTVVL